MTARQDRSPWLGYRVGIALLAATVALYLLQVAIFRDPRDTGFYLLQDLAFVPVQVLLVTLLINRLLAERDRQAMLKKLNMVIGAFYGEAGTQLLTLLARFQVDPGEIGERLAGVRSWDAAGFRAGQRELRGLECHMSSVNGDLPGLKLFLLERRHFILRLLENPNLLEHESFTELLWAVSHLTEELGQRPSLDDLPGPDTDHLSEDIRRAYKLLLAEWLAYLGHLRRDYHYLYSLAVRTNPYDPAASVVIR